jgi:hypothetical protein
MPLNKKQAREITGGLSKPSKMPGPAFNLPASRCITGAKLVKVPGSVCHGCYALKGRYRFQERTKRIRAKAAGVKLSAVGRGHDGPGPGS